MPPRLSETVPILLTAFLKFLTHRLLELADSEAQCRGTQRLIIPELLDMTVYNTMLLSERFQFTTISQAALAGLCGQNHY
ncbi:Histone H2A-Bbd type 2/3 [Lemmus lemmus]